MKKREKVAVGLSGGVDSGVAAVKLIEDGYDVVGVHLRLWKESGHDRLAKKIENKCCSLAHLEAAQQLANQYHFPLYVYHIEQNFYDLIVNYFLEGLKIGITPNPCVFCNQFIRFGLLLEYALDVGATKLATGHYVQLRQEKIRYHLYEAVDKTRDQSYALYRLAQFQLGQALFPLGKTIKKENQLFASDHHLPMAKKAESQDLCFIPGKDFNGFIKRHLNLRNTKGPILFQNGKQIGQHEGLPFYTVGQRKGIQSSKNTPLFVLRKDVKHNALIVGDRAELEVNQIVLKQVNVLQPKLYETSRIMVRVRYHGQKIPCIINKKANGDLVAIFETPIFGVACGQSAVFYAGEEVLGGGVIVKTMRGEND